MTATERLREQITFDSIKKLIQNGASMELISKSFGLSFQKIEEIVKSADNSQN
jgi:hypothetical protein